MLKSMTGYGQATFENDQVRITAEVKTLNAKFLDVNVRIPRMLSDREISYRNLVMKKLERGKITLAVTYEIKEIEDLPIQINESLFKQYYQKLDQLANGVAAPTPDLFNLAIQAPEVMGKNMDKQKIDHEAQNLVVDVINQALVACDKVRTQEGKALAEKFIVYLQSIRLQLAEIEKFESKRIVAIKDRLRTKMESLLGDPRFDENRLEQELIYYIEKLDITEENVRLKKHLNYFEETMEASHSSGKKLAFIAQEIGREINTIGAKANHAVMQKYVVLMKDELEKIKEQLANIL